MYKMYDFLLHSQIYTYLCIRILSDHYIFLYIPEPLPVIKKKRTYKECNIVVRKVRYFLINIVGKYTI